MAAGLTVKIKGDASHFDKTLKSVKGGLSSIKTPLAAVAAGAAAVGAAIGAAAFGAYKLTESLIDAGEAARAEDALLGNVVKQMGIFGSRAEDVTAKMIKYADATELATGIDAGIIKSTQTKLSTFDKVAATADQTGGAFDRATKAALDMSRTFGGDASTYAIMLGKALQDPEKGLAALKKTGALMPEDMKRIGDEFKRTGDQAKAMSNILSAVERQVGNSAEATATGTSRIRAAFNQMRDELAIPVSEQFDKLADTIAKQTPAIVEGFKLMAPQIGTAFNTIFTAIGEAMQGNTDRLFALGGFIGDTIVQGAKTSLLAGATSLTDELIAMMNIPAKLGMQAAKLAGYDINKASNIAAGQVMRAGASEVANNFQRFMAQNAPPIQGVGGSQYRLAMPGESSPFRDETGRMIILLESIDRKLNPTPFPAR